MTIILLLLFLLSIYAVLKNYKSKYAWYFLVICWSLIIILYASFLRLSIQGNYRPIGYIFTNWDRNIFLELTRSKQSFFGVKRLLNTSSTVYFIALPLLMLSYFKEKSTISFLNKPIVKIIIIILPVLSYIFYDPNITLRLYSLVSFHKPIVYNIISIIDMIFFLMICFYIIMPFLLFLFKRKSLFTLYKKRQIIGVGFFVTLSNLIYIVSATTMVPRSLYVLSDPIAMISVYNPPLPIKNDNFLYFSVTILMLLAMLSMFVMITKTAFLSHSGFIDRILVKRHYKFVNKNLRGVFHSIKNTVYSHKVILDEAVNSSGDEREKLLASLSVNMDKYVSQLSAMISANDKQVDFAPEVIYVSDVIDEVLNTFNPKFRIKIVRDYETHIEKIYADAFYLGEAFRNILQNAMEALVDKDNACIEVSIRREFEFVVIVFKDNGIGIDKKILKKVFTPYYTTKSRINNWGIGLTFIYDVIKNHQGNIYIKSKLGKGTDVYILLPREF